MPVKPGENVVRDLLVWLRDHLSEDPWYAEHGVPLLIENQKDILAEVEELLATTTGIAVVLKVPRAENNRPALNVTLELRVLENPLLNRCRANAATALDVAWHAALALDGPAAMLRTVEHVEDEALFIASATLDCVIQR